MKKNTSKKTKPQIIAPTPDNGHTRDTCVKLCGCDTELGNVVLGIECEGGTTHQASAAILRQVDGFPKTSGSATQSTYVAPNQYGYQYSGEWSAYTSGYASWENGYDSGSGTGSQYDPQDYARRWQVNGGCIYGDLGHTEICIPEVRSAYEAVAYFHAMLSLVSEAQQRANAELPVGQKIVVTVNNTDGHGQSWGGHTNFSVTKECITNIFQRKLHHALFLSSYLTSSIIFTGAGKVGSENRRPEVPFELTQRGDYYEALIGSQTTYNRPLVNSRREFHTSYDTNIARLHCIFFDSTLSHGSMLLKYGATQLVLALIEDGGAASDLMLESPLEALLTWNQDPTLTATAKSVTGASYTAAEMQLAILEKVHAYVDTGRADAVVPHARELLALWEDTVERLARKDIDTLYPRIEWILKKCVLERAMAENGLEWDSPGIKHLDHIFSSLDRSEGLYWQYEETGLLEQYATSPAIARAAVAPPEDTRAWLRGRILAHADAESVTDVDWGRVACRDENDIGGYYTSRYHTIELGDPLGSTRADCADALCNAPSLEQALRELGASETDSRGYKPTASASSGNGSIVLVPARAVTIASGPAVHIIDQSQSDNKS